MDTKSRRRAGLTFGIGMAIFNIVRDLLTNGNQTTNQILASIVIGLATGALEGVLFGWLIGLFAKSKFVERTTKITTDPDETALFETPANHFKGIEGVAGKLYLTTKRLIFKSHKLNIQNHQLSINLADIQKVDSYKTVGLINNGLSVTTKQGATEKIVVEQLDKWVENVAEQNGLQQRFATTPADEKQC